MQYFYIQTAKGDTYGSFDTKSEALRYVDYAGFDCDWQLIEGDNVLDVTQYEAKAGDEDSFSNLD